MLEMDALLLGVQEYLVDAGDDRMEVAAVTMTYNEADYLPVWVRYYSAQVGARNCFIFDHGSDDGSTRRLGDVNVIKIPRSAVDDDRQARFLSRFCSSLLDWYDWVVRSDVDEIVVADPARHRSLRHYCEACDHQDVVSGVGFNVVHAGEEAALDPSEAILGQRHWMYFLASMCKPSLIRRSVDWSAGFHRANDAEPTFNDLYLFHLRFADRDIGLRRLAKTRSQPRADPDGAWWHRVADEDCLAAFASYDGLPKRPQVKISKRCPELRDAISHTLGSSRGRLGEADTFNICYEVPELWPIPDRFRPVF
jgi:hypothetical protein